jgi:autotransporter-associated beta strand protein
VTFSNCPSFYANSGPILVYKTLYLRGHGLAPHVFAGAGYDLTFQNSLTPTSTIYVDDLTGDGVTVDDKDDLIVSNKLGTVNANGNNGSSFRGNSSFRKAGKGTMVLSNSNYSSATGDIEVVEGKLVMNGTAAGLSMTGANWTNAAFGAVAGTRTRTVTVKKDAELEFRKTSTTGPYNTPQEWRLVVDGGTLTLANRATTGFGTLELNNATFNYALGEGSGWFPSWGLFSVAQKLAFKGSTPYDLAQTPYSDWHDCPYITLGFTLSSPRDDEPIDPSKPMLTNLWNVVDFEVADITGDSATDATIRLPIRDMVNMSYTSYSNPQINGYTYNPWQWCRFRGGVRKTGAGTLCLNGAITYTHTTEVAAGALLVDSSIATSSGVTVDSGAWLGGTGTVSAVTVKDGGGFICYAGRNRANTLRVPSLTAEGDVVVRVANPDNLDKSAFRQDIVTLTAKPASVNLRNWHISYEGDEDAKAFGFGYDSSTGVVRAWYSGGTMMIFR